MSIFIDNLYEGIIRLEAKKNTDLKVISGYASGTFLKKVCKEFPYLNIRLYIGMTSQGISKSDHEIYCSLTMHNPFVHVYYQTAQISTHMKVIDFKSTDGHSVYVGSANFSENGFVNQREIMVQVKDSMSSVFQYQHAISTICIHEDIEKKIAILPDEIFKLVNSSNNSDKLQEDDTIEYVVHNGNSTKKKKTNYIKRFRSIRSNADPNYYQKFSIEIVQDNITNPRWKDTGINAWVNKKTPILSQKAGIFFDQVFPKDEKFKLYTDDDKIFHGILTGRFNSELKLLDGNFYEYIKERIKLQTFRPISHEDLMEYGVTKLFFERINKNEYIMSFGTS